MSLSDARLTPASRSQPDSDRKRSRTETSHDVARQVGVSVTEPAFQDWSDHVPRLLTAAADAPIFNVSIDKEIG